MDWSLVFSGVTAASTFLLVVGAFLAWRATKKLLTVELKRDERTAEDRRRAQAAQVVLWWENTTATVHNHSPLPVYGVHLKAHAPTGGLDGGDQLLGFSEKDFLGPGQRFQQSLSVDHLRAFGPPPMTRAVVVFRDAAGRRWRRDDDGALTAVDD